MLLQVLYSVRSERQLVEQIQYNLPFRGFVGLAKPTGCMTEPPRIAMLERVLIGGTLMG